MPKPDAGHEGQGRRILVVEDEWLIAEDIADCVRAAGYEVVGPAPSVESALRLVEENEIHAGLLDITLGDEKSYPVATALAARQIPFAFLTGYAAAEISSVCRDNPCLHKPVAADALVSMLTELLDGARAG